MKVLRRFTKVLFSLLLLLSSTVAFAKSNFAEFFDLHHCSTGVYYEYEDKYKLSPDYYRVLGVSLDEFVAIHGYTDCYHRKINQSLFAHSDSYLPYTQVLNEALDHLPKFNGLVKRITSTPPEEISKYSKDAEITYPAYMSTSQNSDYVEIHLFTPCHDKLLIDSFSGSKVDIISTHPQELEVLFKPNSKFRVVSNSVIDCKLFRSNPAETCQQANDEIPCHLIQLKEVSTTSMN